MSRSELAALSATLARVEELRVGPWDCSAVTEAVAETDGADVGEDRVSWNGCCPRVLDLSGEVGITGDGPAGATPKSFDDLDVAATGAAAETLASIAAVGSTASLPDAISARDRLANSIFSDWNSSVSSRSWSISDRITSIWSRCIVPNIWTIMAIACWNWSNICCCITPN